MGVSEIYSLSLKEFEDQLSLINYEYIIAVYKSTLRALGHYQVSAELSKKSEFIGINEYFNLHRENDKEYAEYLQNLFNS